VTGGVSLLREISTSAPDDGATDEISAGNGADVILGGSGADIIDAAGSDVARDVVVGDNGVANFDASGVLVSISTTIPATGGNDDIQVGDGNNVVLGGAGTDTIWSGSGRDVIVGDNGRRPSFRNRGTSANDRSGRRGGRLDDAGDGNNVIFGGVVVDTINAAAAAM